MPSLYWCKKAVKYGLPEDICISYTLLVTSCFLGGRGGGGDESVGIDSKIPEKCSDNISYLCPLVHWHFPILFSGVQS